MPTPTAAQIDAFLNFLDEHRDFARGNLRSVEGRLQCQRLWEEITNILNAMGGCTKTTQQWQKVWTDKKYLAKKASAAARRSASATGGGPSTARPLFEWELKVMSIMGDGYGDRQTSARSLAFVEHETNTTPAAASTQSHQGDFSEVNVQPLDNIQPSTNLQSPALSASDASIIRATTTQTFQQLDNIQPCTSQQAPATSASDALITHPTTTQTSTQQRRRRRHPGTSQADSSVRERLFRLEERRLELEEQRNAELAGIRMALDNICRLYQTRM